MVRQRWRDVLFLHWRFDADVVQASLPRGLSVDTFDGSAWVGITPFLVECSRPGPLPALGRRPSYPEINVRTYVTGPDGRDGLWFFSVDVAAPVTTLAARGTLRLPYHWSDMSINGDGERIRYVCRRRRGDAANDTLVRIEPRPLAAPDQPLADWLVGRWRAWVRPWWADLATVPVEHRPWPLRRAIVIDHDDTLLPAWGRRDATAHPVCFASASVDAKLGWPRACPLTAR